MSSIPLSVPSLKGNEWKYVKECIDTEWVSSTGKYVELFEQKIADYTGSKYAIACINDSSALQVSLCLAGVQPGDEVIVSNFYGPRMGLSHVIPELMKMVIDADNGFINVYSVKHKRTFCYIADAVEMIQLLAEFDQTNNESYNIGNDDEEITMGELAQQIIDLVGKNVVINPLSVTLGSQERRCPS